MQKNFSKLNVYTEGFGKTNKNLFGFYILGNTLFIIYSFVRLACPEVKNDLQFFPDGSIIGKGCKNRKK